MGHTTPRLGPVALRVSLACTADPNPGERGTTVHVFIQRLRPTREASICLRRPQTSSVGITNRDENFPERLSRDVTIARRWRIHTQSLTIPGRPCVSTIRMRFPIRPADIFGMPESYFTAG